MPIDIEDFRKYRPEARVVFVSPNGVRSDDPEDAADQARIEAIRDFIAGLPASPPVAPGAIDLTIETVLSVHWRSLADILSRDYSPPLVKLQVIEGSSLAKTLANLPINRVD